MSVIVDLCNRCSEAWWFCIVHAGWQSAVVGLLLLAVVWAGWRLPSPVRHGLLVLALVKFAIPPLTTLPTGVFGWVTVGEESQDGSTAWGGDLEGSTRLPPGSLTEVSLSAIRSEDPVGDQAVADTFAPPEASLGLKAWLMLAHGLGSLAVLGWIGLEYRRVRGILRAGQALAEGPVLRQCEALCQSMGLRAGPELVVVPQLGSPFVFGLVRPVIVLPKGLTERFSEHELGTVLGHELAHCRRGDMWVNALQASLCALWWFHPVIWMVNRGLRMVREDCCDDFLVGRRWTTGDALCEVLLRVAALRARPTSEALTMTMPFDVNRLGRRIRRNMDDRLTRSTRLSLGALLVLALVAVCLLPGVRGAGTEDDAEAATMSGRAPVRDAADAHADEAAGSVASTRVVRGKVVDKGGQPVEGAEVWLPIAGLKSGERHTLNTKTDAQGRFAIEVPGEWVSGDRVSFLSWIVSAYAPGYSLGMTSAGVAILRGDPSDVIVEIGPTSDISFVILDPEDRPLVGAVVEPLHVSTMEIAGTVPEELMPHFRAVTDSEGRVHLPGLQRDTLRSVRVITKQLGIQEKLLYEYEQSGQTFSITFLRTIRLRPAGRIEGRLVGDNPEVVRGVRLYFRTERHEPALEQPAEGYALLETDVQGRFVVPAIATGWLKVLATLDQNTNLRPKLPRPYEVRVDAGQTTRLELPMRPTIPVRGSIRVRGTRQPVAKAEMSIGSDSNSEFAVSDADGRFAVRILPGWIAPHVVILPEQYARPHRSTIRGVEVPEDAKEFELPPIEVLPGKTVSGRLIDEHTRPVAEARILMHDDGELCGAAISDKEGQFTVSGVFPTANPTTATYTVWFKTTKIGKSMEAKAIPGNPLRL